MRELTDLFILQRLVGAWLGVWAVVVRSHRRWFIGHDGEKFEFGSLRRGNRLAFKYLRYY